MKHAKLSLIIVTSLTDDEFMRLKASATPDVDKMDILDREVDDILANSPAGHSISVTVDELGGSGDITSTPIQPGDMPRTPSPAPSPTNTPLQQEVDKASDEESETGESDTNVGHTLSAGEMPRSGPISGNPEKEQVQLDELDQLGSGLPECPTCHDTSYVKETSRNQVFYCSHCEKQFIPLTPTDDPTGTANETAPDRDRSGSGSSDFDKAENSQSNP